MKQSNLDEMQEQKMLQVEHIGCWLAFWGLLASILVQLMLFRSLTAVAGEFVVFFVLCLYIVVGCLRRGLWDRKLKADPKTNLMASLLASGGLYVFFLVFLLRIESDMSMPKMLAYSLIPAGVTFLLVFGLLTLCAWIYQKRCQQLETE